MRIGYFLSSEEFGPRELLRQARMAEQAGFEGLWISDHFHPWNDEQGHSAFVWSTIGAIAQATSHMKLTTAVTCPTMRIHPAIIAHAAATSAVLMEGRFTLGLGTGEALNEHILGDRWPAADTRLEMLEEAVEVIRTLWQGGMQSHRGRHYQVEKARIYDLPEQSPPILISGFGPKSTSLAARIGDGYCTVGPDADSVESFRKGGGAKKLVAGGMKACVAEDEKQARATVYRLWPNEALPGELAQILPTPAHFEQASEMVSAEQASEDVPCGPDIDRQLEAIQAYADAGFDELYIQQIGDEQERFFEMYASEILPCFSERQPEQGELASERARS
ncbi:MAG: TIGR03557 family F420-dependent LLM class oxidoreductase [Solirubrobacteraceae bacterium]